MSRVFVLCVVLAGASAMAIWLGRDASGALALLDFNDPYGAFIASELRLPRVALAALVGASLASCGLLFQSTLHNPLASEFTLGASAGASMGAMIGVLTGIGTGLFAIGGFAFAGAFIVSTPAYILALRKRVPPEAVLLAGIALSFAAMAVTSGANFVSSTGSVMAFTRWTLGSLPSIGFEKVGVAAIPALAPVALAWMLRYRLDAMSGGEELAVARGIEVTRLRSASVLVVTLAVGATVAVCGPIGFVGLVVPHMARGLVGAGHARLSVATPLLGALLLVSCDFASRNLIRGLDIPIGTATAALGTPVFIWMLVRRFGHGN